MSDKDEHKTDDAILASYLEGRDGLSAAYRALDQEQPPSHLDARILAAAREGEVERVRKQSPAGGFDASSLRGLLSLAASLVLGIMIGSVFLDDLSLQPDAASSMEKAVSQDDSSQQTAVAPRLEADLVTAAESFAAAERLAPEPQLQPGPIRQTAGLNEIVVTGARLQRSDITAATPVAARAEPDYRQTVISWLRQIANLQEQLRNSESTALQQQLDEETALFMDRYPGISLEDEMSSLRRMDSGN